MLVSHKTRIKLMLIPPITLLVLVLVLNNMYPKVSDSELQKNLQSEIEVSIPVENIIIKKGDTMLIPIEIKVNSDELIEGKMWVYGTESKEFTEQESYLDGQGPADKFQELMKKGFDSGFSGELSEESFNLQKNEKTSDTKTIFLSLRASDSMESGDYLFVYSLYTKSSLSEGIRYGIFQVSVR